MDGIKDLSIILKWCGKEYSISELTNQDTVAVLKHEIYKQTSVRPERQKLINLKYKGKLQFAPSNFVFFFRHKNEHFFF